MTDCPHRFDRYFLNCSVCLGREVTRVNVAINDTARWVVDGAEAATVTDLCTIIAARLLGIISEGPDS